MADWRLDQKTEETPQSTDLSMLVRGTSVFKTTFQKIKEFVIGTTSMGTTATDVTGAVKEINDKVGIIDVENDGDIASQLNDMVKKDHVINNCNVTKEGFVADARQMKFLYDLIGSHKHTSLSSGQQLNSFTENISSMLKSVFSVDNVSISSVDDAKYSPLPSVGSAWYTVLTFGIQNRCTQIAIQVYNGTYKNKIYFRTQHDSTASEWVNII